MSAEIRHIAADGATAQPQQTYGPFVSAAVAVASTKTKFGIENIDTRVIGGSPFTTLVLRAQQIGTNDGNSFYWTAADPNGTLSRPWGNGAAGAPVITVLGTGGVWGATGTYGYKVTATNATGQTIGSVEATVVISALTQRASLAWVQTPGATGYKVYRTATPGTYTTPTLRGTVVGGATVNFVDDGSAASAGVPPSDNTTGGAGPTYGTAPVDGSFAQSDIPIASGGVGLAVGQEWFYWAQVRVPAATSSIGNRRTLNVTPIES